MATTIVKVEGLRELDNALAQLPKATARNTLRRVLKKRAEPIGTRMESGAPRDTGYTAGSIGVSETLNPAQRGAAKREGKDFAEVYVGSRRGSAAILQEFGTISQPAHPYMRPAWDSMQAATLDGIAADLAAEIEKSRARLARKAAKPAKV